MINISHVSKVWKDLVLSTPSFNLDINSLPDTDVSKELEFSPISPKRVEDALNKYSISCTCSDCFIGPTVTTYIAKPTDDISYRLRSLHPQDIARELNVNSVRINLTSQGIEIEVENPVRLPLSYKDLFLNIPKNLSLPVILGENSYGFRRYIDLADMPHLLIAGRTGSGKSVFLNTTIITLISKLQPSELQLMLIDPKQVEFAVYNKVPHLFRPVLINEVAAHYMLIELIEEMEKRYELLREYEVRKISDYNKIADKKLPYIVCIIDEYADLILMSSKYKKDIETNVIRLAQKARAAGIHLIIATQKPIAQVLTTLIKSNIPARIAFAVCSSTDSRIILDQKGAENLLGNGDMLFLDPRGNKLERIQAPFLSDTDISNIIKGK